MRACHEILGWGWGRLDAKMNKQSVSCTETWIRVAVVNSQHLRSDCIARSWRNFVFSVTQPVSGVNTRKCDWRYMWHYEGEKRNTFRVLERKPEV